MIKRFLLWILKPALNEIVERQQPLQSQINSLQSQSAENSMQINSLRSAFTPIPVAIGSASMVYLADDKFKGPA